MFILSLIRIVLRGEGERVFQAERTARVKEERFGNAGTLPVWKVIRSPMETLVERLGGKKKPGPGPSL